MAQAPPLPPEVQAQADSPEAAQSVFAQQGVGQPQPGMEAVQMAVQKVQELDKWAGEMNLILTQLAPPLRSFLMPIAQAGKDLLAELQKTAQRSGMANGSPVVGQAPPQNPGAPPPDPNAQ